MAKRKYKLLEAIAAFPSIVLEELVNAFKEIFSDERKIIK